MINYNVIVSLVLEATITWLDFLNNQSLLRKQAYTMWLL